MPASLPRTDTARRRFLQRLGARAMAGGAAAVLAAPTVAGASPAVATAVPARASGGRFEMLALASRHVAPRSVTVWLPPGYDGQRPHAVIYLHDGQNLFVDAQAYGGVAWRADRALAALLARGAPPAILVGIPNAGQDRWREYAPAAALRTLPPALQSAAAGPEHPGPLLADAYVRCIADELKPAIDARYRTAPGRDTTALMGSSMGGLISAHALASRPETFGRAACLSTHWPLAANPALYPEADRPADPRLAEIAACMPAWLARALPPPGRHRLYFDHGTEQLDALYPPLQAAVDTALQAAGWHFGRDRLSLAFPGTGHHERDWAARLEVPLAFLLA